MKTATLKLGPRDHGRQLSVEEFRLAEYRSGYEYELIDGRLYVTHQPKPPQDYWVFWLHLKLLQYCMVHPEIVNYISEQCEVHVTSKSRPTFPEPDIAVFADYPKSPLELEWSDVSPLLVVEVLSVNDPDKDLVRNVDLYLRVPIIKEYWVLDNRTVPDRPTMRVHRRHGKKWRIIDLVYGDTYTTKLLPGFELTHSLES